jgi:hypothetical protein
MQGLRVQTQPGTMDFFKVINNPHLGMNTRLSDGSGSETQSHPTDMNNTSYVPNFFNLTVYFFRKNYHIQY